MGLMEDGLGSATVNIVQSLNLHSATVTQLVWAPENYYHDSKNPYTHRLASADASGRIVIWDVASATPLAEASENDSSVCGMHWISDQDISRDLLLILHTENKLVLWNAQTCTPLWKKNYSYSINSMAFDPFSSHNIIRPNQFIVVNDLSWNSSPETSGKQILVSDIGHSNDASEIDAAGKRFSQTIKATAKAVIAKSFFRLSTLQKNSERFHTSNAYIGNEAPLQILYHGFRKQHTVFVYSREIVFFDMILSQCVGGIRLDQSSASFVQVYCCHQADALICLHQNGTVSLHYCLSAFKPPPMEEAFSHAPTDLKYHFLCESKSLRRGRNLSVVAMTVDPSTELTVTVATSDGRLQFLSIESDAPSKDGWPQWTLMDMVKALNLEEIKSGTTLRFRFTGFYCGGSPSPTVCCACPPHFLLPFAAKIKHDSLVAVGTTRGTVQIWDLCTTKMWREYLLVNGPVYGLAWGILRGEAGSGLILFVHSHQTSESSSGGSGSSGTAQEPVKPALSVHNTVVRIELETGRQQLVLTQSADIKELHLFKLAMQKPVSAIKPSKWLNEASKMTNFATANVTPIRSLNISNFGQYLAILYENWPLEIWDAQRLVLLKSFSLQGSRPVALTWSNASLSSSASSPQSNTVGLKSSALSGDSNVEDFYMRETFILCTSPLSLKLFTVEGFNVDTMPISNTIVQSLPRNIGNCITCASWRSPMIAFGMADGCVAVRNLQTKKTITRYMTGFVSDSNFTNNPSTSTPDSIGFSSAIKGELIGANGEIFALSYVKKVEFLFSGGLFCHLLTLCNGGVAVWEPEQMVLLCATRFGASPQKIPIDATWTSAPLSPPNSAPTCVLLAPDGSLLLATAGSSADSRSIIESRVECGGASAGQDSSPEDPDEYLAVSQFEFNSSLSTDVESNDFLYLPSLLPTNVALTIRHLLQHQPWRSSSSSIPKVDNGCEFRPVSSAVTLACPPLGTTFANVQSSADRFFTKFRSVKHLCAPFESSQLSIVERCLLTAQLFGDSYETAFWRVAASQLLTTKISTEAGMASAASRSRRFGLTDLVWDELTEESTYRAAVVERVNRLLHEATAEQSKLRTQFLLMLGFRHEAIEYLTGYPTESASFSFNIHRACLLASQGYIRDLEAAIADGESESLSAARLNYTSSVKLLAASLISTNRLYEGVEMLCMLGMHLEACQYLETYREWETAIWLAKCTLSKKECDGVMHRWATYLASTANCKTLAILVLVYLGQHNSVLSLLKSLRQHQLAARYLEACLECRAVIPDPKTEELHSQVFLEFATTLTSIGQREAALYYAGLAGDLGKPLRDEIDFLLN
uniref:WD repeat containing protein 11 n=1 Tax=Echinococcus granulosus TaxID=6210 RepID=A0A068W7K4_ECHGR|nr:WD repeat containing protein 11 [Echinococcus granulosus]